jgi:hypothetical protein
MAKVGKGLASRGTPVTAPLRVVLRPEMHLRSQGYFSGSHMQQGVTQYTTDGAGRLVGDVTVAVAAGLPAVEFRSVVAHEAGHSMLAAGRRGQRASDVVEEGFCEVLAYLHLTLDDGTPRAVVRARLAMAGSDPVYSQGLRIVWKSVQVHGLLGVLDALRTGRTRQVGLPG